MEEEYQGNKNLSLDLSETTSMNFVKNIYPVDC